MVSDFDSEDFHEIVTFLKVHTNVDKKQLEAVMDDERFQGLPMKKMECLLIQGPPQTAEITLSKKHFELSKMLQALGCSATDHNYLNYKIEFDDYKITPKYLKMNLLKACKDKTWKVEFASQS